MKLIKKYKDQLIDICSKYEVEKLFVFGSILTDNFNEKSDIDFVVSIYSENPLKYAENYFALKKALEDTFNRQIDLLEQKAIKNKTFETLLNQQKVLVYAR